MTCVIAWEAKIYFPYKVIKVIDWPINCPFMWEEMDELHIKECESVSVSASKAAKFLCPNKLLAF